MSVVVVRFGHDTWVRAIPQVWSAKRFLAVIHGHIGRQHRSGDAAQMYAFRYEGRLLDMAQPPWWSRTVVQLRAEGRLLGGSPVTYPTHNIILRTANCVIHLVGCFLQNQ